MAYVHCHSCPWSQDDFWDRGYNPLRFFFKNEFTYYFWPRFIGGDPEFVNHTKFSKALRLTKVVEEPWTGEMRVYDWKRGGDVTPKTCKHHYAFSWLLMLRSIRKWLKRVREQVWWTNADWKAAIAANGGKW